jgi:uncharacterized protein with FMN-binding domain
MSARPWRGTLIFAGTVAAVAATAAARFAGTETTAPNLAGSPAGSSSAVAGGGTSGTASGTAKGAAAPAANGSAVTIVGSTVQTPYGPVQVSVTFNGSSIADVQALQSPNWHGQSVQINAYAIPVLNQEAVAAGSSNINSVSGATFTSDAYKQSLQAAISQHK